MLKYFCATLLVLLTIAVCPNDAQAIPNVLEKVGPYLILSYRVNAASLTRAINNPNIIIDTYEGSAWISITMEDNFIDFGDSGILPNVSLVGETRETSVRIYASVRNPAGPGYLKGTIGAYFNHPNPTVCEYTVTLIHAVWGVTCQPVDFDYQRYRVGSTLDMDLVNGAGHVSVSAVQGDAVSDPSDGLVGFLTDPERFWEFGYNAGNSTTHLLKHDPFVIYDIHYASIQSFSSNFVSTLSGGQVRDPTGFAVPATALWAMRYDDPHEDFYIIPGGHV